MPMPPLFWKRLSMIRPLVAQMPTRMLPRAVTRDDHFPHAVALGPAGVRKLFEGTGSVQDLSARTCALSGAARREAPAIDGSDTRILDELGTGGHPVAGLGENGKLVVEKPGRKMKQLSSRG